MTQETIDLIARYPLPKLDDIQFLPDAESYEEKRQRFYDVVRDVASGITQIIIHPADHTKALEFILSRWQNQVWKARLFMDPEVHVFLSKQRLHLINWPEMMDRFENGHRYQEDHDSSDDG